ncbi:MAG TPA: flagellar motor protein MotB [Roseateles sp.]|nr:flagellar motor protein MotB [Roseateles sp.]
MAIDTKKPQTIIVRRVRKQAHAHHGGAWKIAYADFVTAMMAFFLLMWLLGATTEGDRKGIADYFSTPPKLARVEGGSGLGDGSHVLKGGGTDLTRSMGQVRRGEVVSPQSASHLRAMQEAAEQAALKRRVVQVLSQHPRLAQFLPQIRIDITPDGLRIQIVDEQNRPMFDSGSAQVKDYMREILREIGAVLAEVNNKVSLTGHTDAAIYQRGERGYSNWELSADRANASRRELVAGGLQEGQVVRVLGLASSALLDKEDPRNAVNRRISIIVMNRDAERRFERDGDVEIGSAAAVGPALSPGPAD